MKVGLIFLILILFNYNGYSQFDQYGFSSHFSINDISHHSKVIQGNRQAISRSLVENNRNLSYGVFLQKKKYIIGINLDFSSFSKNFMFSEKVLISDFYKDREHYVTESLEPEDLTESTDEVGMSVLLGINFYTHNRISLNFSNRIGIRSVSDRKSSVVLKESGTNNYYIAEYKFKVSPLLSFNPSVEFEYLIYKEVCSLFLYSGIYMQHYYSNTQKSITDVKSLPFPVNVTSSDNYINLSATFMCGFGLKVRGSLL